MTHQPHRAACVALLLLLAPGGARGRSTSAQTGLLTSAESERRAALLKANGFVVDADVMVENVQEPYVALAHGSTPVFVSSDAMLYLWFEAHRTITRDLERQRLWPLTQRLVNRLWASHQAQLRAAADGPPVVRAAGGAQSLALAVALRLSEPQAALPADLASAAQSVLGLIQAATQTQAYPGEDYTQYRPRGPYADDPTLARYFRLAKWLGRQPIPLQGAYASPDTVRRAAWMVAALRRDPEALADYHRLAGARRLLAGAANGSDADELHRALTAVLGQGWTLTALADDEACRRVLAELLRPGYTPLAVTTGAVWQGDPKFPTRGFALLPEHALPDSVIIQRGFDRQPAQFRPAVGLRVAVALGIREAEPLLATEAGAQDAEIAALRADGQQLCQPDGASIHQRWLALLAALPLRDPRAPAFMRTDAWAAKTIATALASWAQLRHNSVLYGAQPYMPMAGMSPEEEPPLGWVEPNPIFWRQYAALCGRFTTDLRALNLLTPSAARLLRRFEEQATAFATAAESELAGRPLPDRGLFIQKFGTWVQDLPFDKPTVVADVATDSDLGVIYAGSGYFHPITVLFPKPNGRGMAEGAGLVSSYYEFGRPHGQRLTDREWQGLLAADHARPDPPSWTDTFAFRRAVATDEHSATLRQAQRDLLAGRDEQALAVLRGLAAAQPDGELAVRARMVVAREYQRREDWDKVAAELADVDRWYGCAGADEAKGLLTEARWWREHAARTAEAERELQTRLAATEPRPGLSAADELARQNARAATLLTAASGGHVDAGLPRRVIEECPRSNLVPAARLMLAVAPLSPHAFPTADPTDQLPALAAIERDCAGSWLAEKAAAVAARFLACTDPDAAFRRLQPYLGAPRSSEPYPAAAKLAMEVLHDDVAESNIRPGREVLRAISTSLLHSAFRRGRFDLFQVYRQAMGERTAGDAGQELMALVDRFASREPQALKLWAAAAERSDEPSRSLLRDLAARYPRSGLAPWALYRLTQPDDGAGFTPAQLKDVEHLRRQYPTSAAALFRGADLARRNGDLTLAGRLERSAWAKIEGWPEARALAGWRTRRGDDDEQELPEAVLAPWRPLLPGLSTAGLRDAVRRIRPYAGESERRTAWLRDLRRLLPALTTEDLVHYVAVTAVPGSREWPQALDELCRKAGGPTTAKAAELLLAADRVAHDGSREDLAAAARFVRTWPADARSVPLRLRLIRAGHELFLTATLNSGTGPEFEAALSRFQQIRAVREGPELKGDFAQHRRAMEALAAEHRGRPLAAVAMFTAGGELLRHGWLEQAVECYRQAVAAADQGPLRERAAAALSAADAALTNKRKPPLAPAWTVPVSAPYRPLDHRVSPSRRTEAIAVDRERVYAAVPLAGEQHGLVALRRDSGALVWRLPVGEARALTVSEGSVYCAVADKLLALEPASGELRWQAAGRGGPLVALPDGVVQVVGRRLQRLRAADGALVWEQPVDRLAEGVPLVCGDRLLLAAAGSGPDERGHVSARLRALALADGGPLWQVELGPDGKEETATRAQHQPWLLADGRVLLACVSGRLPTGTTFARFDPATGRRLDARMGSVQSNWPGWQGRSVAPGAWCVLVRDHANEDTVCYEVVRGDREWRGVGVDGQGGQVQAAATVVPGGFLLARGRVLGVRDRGTGAPLRSLTLPEQAYDVVVVDGAIYALTQGGALLKLVL